MLKTHERIVAAQDLAQQVETVLANAQQEPLIITKHGRPAAYLISVELFDRLMAELEALNSSELATNITAADKQFNEGAFKTLEEVETIVASGQNASQAPSSGALYVSPERPAMQQEEAAFQVMLPKLLARYEGEYVAIHQGQVVDHDADRGTLVMRLDQSHPDEVVLVRQVTEEPERVLRMPSLQLTGYLDNLHMQAVKKSDSRRLSLAEVEAELDL